MHIPSLNRERFPPKYKVVALYLTKEALTDLAMLHRLHLKNQIQLSKSRALQHLEWLKALLLLNYYRYPHRSVILRPSRLEKINFVSKVMVPEKMQRLVFYQTLTYWLQFCSPYNRISNHSKIHFLKHLQRLLGFFLIDHQ